MSVLISALHPMSGERVNVILDSGEEIKTTLAVVAEFRLFAGRLLEEQELEVLRSAAALSLCKTKALELLNLRPMSCQELKKKLTDKGEGPEIADACVQWMEEQGFLNDERYSAQIARHYAAKGYGEGRVRQELRRRGIDRELWDEALTQMPEQDGKLDRFIASRLRDPEDREQIRKISAALFRRGYSWESIRSALSRARAEFEDEP